MGYVDFILNLAGLLLWLNWRSVRFDPLNQRTPATLMGTLRPAAPQKIRRWHLLVIIAGLLPILWSHGAGADVMKRIATPMIGGVVTSTVMELAVYPAIFYLWRSRRLAEVDGSPRTDQNQTA